MVAASRAGLAVGSTRDGATMSKSGADAEEVVAADRWSSAWYDAT